MELINCVAVDDDELDRLAVELCLEKLSFIKLLGSFANPLECVETLNRGNVHLLFLDIDMPEVSGLQFLQSLKNPPLCIFITSHPEYALKGFETHAFDFIVKPVMAQRLESSIMRAREYLQMQSKAKLYDVHFADDYLVIKEAYDIIQIKISDIIYLEALKDYTKIITATKTYLTLSNLKNFFEKLPGNRFLRVHRSFAVAVSQIRTFENNELLLDNFRLPVGKTFRSELSRALLS